MSTAVVQEKMKKMESREWLIKTIARRTLSVGCRERIKPKLKWLLVAFHGIYAHLRSAKQIWCSALPTELYFWDYWLTSHGAAAPEDYKRRLDPDCPIDEFVSRFIHSDHCDILDVGAGPLTILGKIHQGHRLNIVAVDVLADEYNELLARHGITPIVKTQRLEGEKLTARFQPFSFDITYAENCLDHCYDPALAIDQMFTVTRSGGAVILIHCPNEGQDGGYLGLHQWNFLNKNGEFVIESPARPAVNISARYAKSADLVVTTRQEDGFLVVTMFKH